VTWDLSTVRPGIYTATVEVQDNKKHRALSSVIVKPLFCGDCVDSFMCPPILVTCYDEVKAGTPITCKFLVVGPSSDLITYECLRVTQVEKTFPEELAAGAHLFRFLQTA
jgi:hypothetical protein